MQMKTFTVLVLSFFGTSYINAFIVSDKNIKIKFKISEFTKCLDEKNAKIVHSDVSLSQCVLDCGKRSTCVALNYRRQMKQCEQFTSTNGNLMQNSKKTGPCVFISKTDLMVTVLRSPGSECSCQAGKACDTVNRYCLTTVCPKLELENGSLFGHMTEVGARVTYTCDDGFIEKDVKKFSTCQEDGLWTHEPKCIRECHDPATHPNSTISAGLTTEGATRTYSCDDFYRMSVESMTSQTTCGTDGKWSATDFQCILDYQYLGCFMNYGDNRILSGLQFADSNHMTPEYCVTHCFSHGYSYAAPEATEHCFCGNATAHSEKASESDCNLGCTGDSSLICGSNWRASVFKKTDDDNYLGCYKDMNPGRILDGPHVTGQPQMSTTFCLDMCRSHGLRYAYTELSSQCFCGNELLTVEKRADNECNTPCSGNEAEFCGAMSRASLYTTD